MLVAIAILSGINIFSEFLLLLFNEEKKTMNIFMNAIFCISVWNYSLALAIIAMVITIFEVIFITIKNR